MNELIGKAAASWKKYDLIDFKKALPRDFGEYVQNHMNTHIIFSPVMGVPMMSWELTAGGKKDVH